MKKIKLIFLTVLGLVGVGVCHGSGSYEVRIGPFSNGDSAKATIFNNPRMNCIPYEIESGSEGLEIVFGDFRNYPEARIILESVSDNSGTSSRIIKNEFPKKSLVNALAFAQPFFNDKGFDASPLNLKGIPKYENLARLDSNSTRAEFYSSLTLARQDLSLADPIRGYIDLNKGIEAIRRADLDTALMLLNPVANGDVASSKSHRISAMKRVAWINHQKGNLIPAYQAFLELSRRTALVTLRDECLVECDGLLMEIAENLSLGDHRDVQTAIERDLKIIPANDEKNRAILELMYHETYSRQPQPDFQKAATLGEQFISKYKACNNPSLKREIAAATVQTGQYWRRAGDYEKAKSFYVQALLEYDSSVDYFAGADPAANALLGLSNLAGDMNDVATRNHLIWDLIDRYPSEPAAQSALKYVNSLGIYRRGFLSDDN